MTTQEFWEGDSTLPIFYRKAKEIKRREDNFNAWLQGLYMAEAINAVFGKDANYPEMPFGEAELQEKERRAHMTEEELIAEEAERIGQALMQFNRGR